MAAITSTCPSILILDWEMPEADGSELSKWLRRQELPHSVYTIFLTHRTGSEEIEQALDIAVRLAEQSEEKNISSGG